MCAFTFYEVIILANMILLHKPLNLTGMSFIIVIVDTDKKYFTAVLSYLISIAFLFYLLDGCTRRFVMF